MDLDLAHTHCVSKRPAPVLRPAGDSDAEFLLRVYAGTREDVAQVPWGDEQRGAFLRMQYEAQRSDYERRFPAAEHSVVLVDGMEVGRIWVDRRADEIRLLDIALLPEFCGRGTGTVLLRDLIEEARRSGKPLRHSVLKENRRAMRLYARLGFVEAEDFGLYLLMEHVAG